MKCVPIHGDGRVRILTDTPTDIHYYNRMLRLQIHFCNRIFLRVGEYIYYSIAHIVLLTTHKFYRIIRRDTASVRKKSVPCPHERTHKGTGSLYLAQVNPAPLCFYPHMQNAQKPSPIFSCKFLINCKKHIDFICALHYNEYV